MKTTVRPQLQNGVMGREKQASKGGRIRRKHAALVYLEAEFEPQPRLLFGEA